jgi:hypothetical protein
MSVPLYKMVLSGYFSIGGPVLDRTDTVSECDLRKHELGGEVSEALKQNESRTRFHQRRPSEFVAK